MQQGRRLIVLCVAILVALVSYIFWMFELPLGSFGTIDFQQYWATWRTLREGSNPYGGDYSLLQSSHTEASGILTTYNPPWTAVFLSPILSLPFPSAALAWFMLEICFLCLIAVYAPRALGRTPKALMGGAIATGFFLPFFDAMFVGQLGILMALAIVLFLLWEGQGRLFLAGLALIPLTFKPHLFLLFCVPGFLWMRQLSSKQLGHFVGGSVGVFATLVALTLCVAPASLGDWLETFLFADSSHGEQSLLLKWQTATLATGFRALWGYATGYYPLWPMWVIPLSGFLGTIVFFGRYKRPIVWHEVTPWLLCVSLATASYGWLFDQSVLVVCQIAIVCDALTYRNRLAKALMISSVVLVEVIGFKLRCTPGVFYHHFVWFPVAMLALLYLNQRFLACERSVVS